MPTISKSGTSKKGGLYVPRGQRGNIERRQGKFPSRTVFMKWRVSAFVDRAIGAAIEARQEVQQASLSLPGDHRHEPPSLFTLAMQRVDHRGIEGVPESVIRETLRLALQDQGL